MRCDDCPRFQAEEQVCRDGKVNPHSLDAAREVAKYMGLRAICTLNDFREALVNIRSGAPPQHGSNTPTKRKDRTNWERE